MLSEGVEAEGKKKNHSAHLLLKLEMNIYDRKFNMRHSRKHHTAVSFLFIKIGGYFKEGGIHFLLGLKCSLHRAVIDVGI